MDSARPRPRSRRRLTGPGAFSDSSFKQREGMGTRSRGAMRPSFCVILDPPDRKRAQGRPGARRTHGPRATKKHAAEPQVRAEQPAFPAQWFYGLYALSPVTRLCCHRCLRDAKHHRTRSGSLGAPGPHDLAVRKSRVRLTQLSRPPHLTATFVTIAIRPSSAVRRAELNA